MLISVINNLNGRNLFDENKKNIRRITYRNMMQRELSIINSFESRKFGKLNESDNKKTIWLKELKKAVISDKIYNELKRKMNEFVYDDYSSILLPYLKSLGSSELDQRRKIYIGGLDLILTQVTNIILAK